MQLTNAMVMAQMIEMVQKGIISTSALASDGKLNPEQANEFIDDKYLLRKKI